MAGLLGGLPGAGATMRPWSTSGRWQDTDFGALHALVLLAVVLGAGGLARQIPHAVLAGILIRSGPTSSIGISCVRHGVPQAPMYSSWWWCSC